VRSIKAVLSESDSVSLQDAQRKAGSPAGIREGDESDRSVEGEQLERAYKNVPVLFNSINKYAEMIMSRDRELSGPNSEFYKKWLGGVGEIGGYASWDEIHSKIYRYQMIYGEAFVEIVRDSGTGEPVDLAFLDPKKMDYARIGSQQRGTGAGDIALTEYQNPVGYVQDLDDATNLDDIEQVYDPPSRVSVGATEVYIPAENIAHFKLFETGEGFYPTGMVDPVFKDAERSFQLKADYADSAHMNLFPTRVSYVGDENHEPTPEEVGDINEQMKMAKHSTEWTYPYYVDLEMLEPENPDAMLEFFQHFNEEISAGIGIPHAVATGRGEDVNRATLRTLDALTQISMNGIVTKTSRNVERQIFEVIADYHGHSEIPRYEWDLDVKYGYGGEPTTDEGVDEDVSVAPGDASEVER